MAQLSKLQIRAKVLSVISDIKSLNSFNEDLMNKFVEELDEYLALAKPFYEAEKSYFDLTDESYTKKQSANFVFCWSSWCGQNFYRQVNCGCPWQKVRKDEPGRHKGRGGDTGPSPHLYRRHAGPRYSGNASGRHNEPRHTL